MDEQERRRLVRVALRAVVGDEVRRLEVTDGPEHVSIGDLGGPGGFGVWTVESALGDDPPPYLRYALDLIDNDLSETRAFWGVRLPLCPLHPDVHALTLEITEDAVVGTCPVAGVVRRVPC